MKHLKKIFESEEKLDTEYIQMCFAEFIDQGCEYEVEDWNGESYIELMPNLPGIIHKDGNWQNTNKEQTFDDMLKTSRELFEFYENIDECIKKVKIKYPNIHITCEKTQEGYHDTINLPFDAYLNICFSLKKIDV